MELPARVVSKGGDEFVADDDDFLWLQRFTVFTKPRDSSVLRTVTVDDSFVCWAFWRTSLSFVAAPVTAGTGVRA